MMAIKMKSEGALTPDSIVERAPFVVDSPAGDNIVMVSIENGIYYGQSDGSRVIWERIQHPVKIADIVNELVGAYDVDRHLCEEQTLSFLETLLVEGLLRLTDEKTS